jgi:hypothetical protein
VRALVVSGKRLRRLSSESMPLRVDDEDDQHDDDEAELR